MGKRLTFPAPTRASTPASAGQFQSHPWTVEEVRACVAAGGWFKPGGHDFADSQAARLAYDASAEELLK
jgi:hypothetical protein